MDGLCSEEELELELDDEEEELDVKILFGRSSVTSSGRLFRFDDGDRLREDLVFCSEELIVGEGF